MWTYVPISVTTWYIVGCGTGACWHLSILVHQRNPKQGRFSIKDLFLWGVFTCTVYHMAPTSHSKNNRYDKIQGQDVFKFRWSIGESKQFGLSSNVLKINCIYMPQTWILGLMPVRWWIQRINGKTDPRDTLYRKNLPQFSVAVKLVFPWNQEDDISFLLLPILLNLNYNKNTQSRFNGKQCNPVSAL